MEIIMTTIYSELPLLPATTQSHLSFKKNQAPTAMSTESPAISVLIDCNSPFTLSIDASTHIDHALEFMKYNHIGVLFVTQEDDSIVGIITANDIIGEKPMLYLLAHEGPSSACTRADVLVRDLMEPIEQLALIKYDALQLAKVGDVLETFKKTGEYYLLVVNTETSNNDITIRGLLSAVTIEKQLGIHLDIAKIPTSFSEVEHSLAHA
jgi:predicted transcriptional regulator